MKIFVINLPKDVHRLAHISRQLDKLGLEYEIVPGILGAGLSPEDRRIHYNDKRAKWKQSRSLVPAEIGCALSHLKVYREIVERGIERALVLEDDVVLPADLEVFIGDCEATLAPKSPEVWLLSPAKAREGSAGRKLPASGRNLLPLHSGVYTSSYILTAIAAEALLAELYPVGDVADCWNRMQRYKVVDLSVAVPHLTEQNQKALGSSTTDDLRQAVGDDRLTWITYKLRRTRAVMWELLYAPYRRFMRHHRSSRIDGRR